MVGLGGIIRGTGNQQLKNQEFQTFCYPVSRNFITNKTQAMVSSLVDFFFNNSEYLAFAYRELEPKNTLLDAQQQFDFAIAKIFGSLVDFSSWRTSEFILDVQQKRRIFGL